MLKQTCARPFEELIVPMLLTVALKQVGVEPEPGMAPPVPVKVCAITPYVFNKIRAARKYILITPNGLFVNVSVCSG
jgi:hypothetical protein